MSGKGDKQRPLSVSRDEWSKNWELAFSNKKKAKPANKNKSKKTK